MPRYERSFTLQFFFIFHSKPHLFTLLITNWRQKKFKPDNSSLETNSIIPLTPRAVECFFFLLFPFRKSIHCLSTRSVFPWDTPAGARSHHLVRAQNYLHVIVNHRQLILFRHSLRKCCRLSFALLPGVAFVARKISIGKRKMGRTRDEEKNKYEILILLRTCTWIR